MYSYGLMFESFLLSWFESVDILVCLHLIQLLVNLLQTLPQLTMRKSLIAHYERNAHWILSSSIFGTGQQVSVDFPTSLWLLILYRLMLVSLKLLSLQGLSLVVCVDTNERATVMSTQCAFDGLLVNWDIVILLIMLFLVSLIVWKVHLVRAYNILFRKNIIHRVITAQWCNSLILLVLVGVKRKYHLLLLLVLRICDFTLSFIQVLPWPITLLGQLLCLYLR